VDDTRAEGGKRYLMEGLGVVYSFACQGQPEANKTIILNNFILEYILNLETHVIER
jgi:hypothetical protein